MEGEECWKEKGFCSGRKKKERASIFHSFLMVVKTTLLTFHVLNLKNVWLVGHLRGANKHKWMVKDTFLQPRCAILLRGSEVIFFTDHFGHLFMRAKRKDQDLIDTLRRAMLLLTYCRSSTCKLKNMFFSFSCVSDAF